ncbi:MAG: bifunctional YncE family protein/alkaline phosphatase family protein [Deltaproteobacteria bacterium]|nr:bifunctional YncE family protein/alkaline phosphatase family protein [Deltaproteobacteria bacterium]
MRRHTLGSGWRLTLARLGAAAVLLGAGCGGGGGTPDTVTCTAPAPPAEALLRAGAQQGARLLPGGRLLTPEGIETAVGGFPVEAVVHPTLAVAYVANTGYSRRGVQVVDLATGAVVQDAQRAEAFYGLALAADGTRLWAAGGSSGVVDYYDVGADGLLTRAGQVEPGEYPAGLALSADGTRLWVALFGGQAIVPVDVQTLAVGTPIMLGIKPYGLVLVPQRNEAYATGFADSRVAIADLGAATVTRLDLGAGSPLGLAASADGSSGYATVADGDVVVRIDTATRAVAAAQQVGEASIADAAGQPLPASSPTGIALDPATGRLFVARSADNAVSVFDGTSLAVLGAIPVGWYPTGVALSPDGGTLVVANGKGMGTGPLDAYGYGNESGKESMTGSVSVITLAGLDLAALAAKVEANVRRPGQVYPFTCDGSFPVPTTAGGSTPIEHIVLIVRENKTYDTLLGALGSGDGDPDLVLYGEEITPNIHALAREFVNHDNFYDDSECSVQGHLWLTSSFVNDYMERIWLEDYRGNGYGAESVTPQGTPEFGTFFTHLIKHGVTFTNFGEVVGSFGDYHGDAVLDHTDLAFPGTFFNTDVKDQEKAEHVAAELVDKGKFPQFVFLLLPNDHTSGTHPGTPTPEAMIADNDYATGLIVDRISKSKYWASTAIFIVEDDPQIGADHVDYHRSICIVASSWAKRGYVSSVHTSYPSLFRTFELILGIPPMNRYDALATPFFDAFASTRDDTPYDVRPNLVGDQLNPADAPGAWYSMQMDFSGPDRNPDLGALLWWARKGAPPENSRLARELRGEVPSRYGAAAGAAGDRPDGRDDDGADDRARDVYDASWKRFEQWLAAHPEVKADLRPRRKPPARRAPGW